MDHVPPTIRSPARGSPISTPRLAFRLGPNRASPDHGRPANWPERFAPSTSLISLAEVLGISIEWSLFEDPRMTRARSLWRK